jgi:hypothetical protein
MVEFQVAEKYFSQGNDFCKPIAYRKKSSGFSNLMLRLRKGILKTLRPVS